MLKDSSTEAVVIDVRREDEWITGHVRGAIHIPIDDLLDRLGELPDQKVLLFICAAGVRSGLACEFAASAGIPSNLLYNIEDGTPDWIANNYPTDIGN
jgi:rhodanese-related sulfurtransferase